jgi:hypothetical protein
MASVASRQRPERSETDPGAALIELLGFADVVRSSRPEATTKPLAFPVLAARARQFDGVGGGVLRPAAEGR